MKTLKVGMMPGRLTEVVVEDNATAQEVFELAGVVISNHEIRLDGEKVDLDSVVSNGSLLVAMKQIKGNCECDVCTCELKKKTRYITSLDEVDIYHILGEKLPIEISVTDVKFDNDFVILSIDSETYIFDKDTFLSVYELIEEVDNDEWLNEPTTQPVLGQIFDIEEEEEINVIAEIDEMIKDIQTKKDRYVNWVENCDSQMDVLKELKYKILG